jgi:acyl-CoA synthetase (AMP-forming)/AMP-acid ligase II
LHAVAQCIKHGVSLEAELTGPVEHIGHCVSRYALERPEQDAIIFLERGEIEAERLTYAELDVRAASYAAGFEAEGLAGSAVAISMPPGGAFVALFLGCLRAGAIAVPLPLPDSDRSSDRITSLLLAARPAALVTTRRELQKLQRIVTGVPIFDHERLSGHVGSREMTVAGHQPALIQYTSGSTQAPKGVVITHANLMANQRMIHQAFDLPDGVIGVTWLPHFHDMGLIGTILQPLFLGGTAVIMAPRAFVQKPIRWLRAIERYRAHTAGGPSFGYDICTRMIEPADTAQLDLSTWQRAFCGAEPIRSRALEDFAQHFAPAGFRKCAFLPCYGLAETTLITTAAKPSAGLKLCDISLSGGGSRPFVSCGRPVGDSSVLVRDEMGRDAAFGEVCVGGPHVSPGTWNGETCGITPFANMLSENGRNYLRTGDLGAFVDGELVVLDRLKDVLVLYGAKLHAVDIEKTVLDHNTDIRTAAAFPVDDGSRERLVLLCEVDRRRLSAMESEFHGDEIAKRVSEAHGVLPEVRFLPYGDLPRTSSGKIQRFAARIKFLSGAWGIPNVADGTAVISE